MKTTHKWYAIGFTLVMAGLYVIFFSPGKEKSELIDQNAAMEALQAAGEKAYQKAYLAPLIATHEKVLALAPDSVDTQKKLVAAYLEIGDITKARPLLEKLANSKDPDATQYRTKLDEISQ